MTQEQNLNPGGEQPPEGSMLSPESLPNEQRTGMSGAEPGAPGGERQPGMGSQQPSTGGGTVEGYTPPTEPQYPDRTPGETYTVQDGDTLQTIAARFYGTVDEWQRVFEANQDRVSNPDLLYPGQELSIPGRQ